MLICAPTIMFELSVIFFGLRLVKHEAIVALLALIEAKKDYVRYISHELRTPLSAAMLVCRCCMQNYQPLRVPILSTKIVDMREQDRFVIYRQIQNVSSFTKFYIQCVEIYS